MRILAIETSGRHGSIAALVGDDSHARLRQQIVLGGDERTAQALAPALQQLLSQVGWSAREVEVVAVAVGPGSFTGLRIGVTTAKTFAYATNARIVGVNSLAVIAHQARQDDDADAPLWTVLDAQRRELFAARFLPNGGWPPAECDVSILRQDQWLAQLDPGDRVAGPPLKSLKLQLAANVRVAEESHWQPMAAGVGQVGWRRFLAGTRDDPWSLLPQYFRASAAEEKLT